MNFIEPDGVDLEVNHKHLTETEAAEIADFIQKYKAGEKTGTVTFKVEVKKGQDLDFLTALLQRLNLKWTVTEG